MRAIRTGRRHSGSAVCGESCNQADSGEEGQNCCEVRARVGKDKTQARQSALICVPPRDVTHFQSAVSKQRLEQHALPDTPTAVATGR